MSFPRTARFRALPILFACLTALLSQLPAGAAVAPLAAVTGNATWFDGLGQPYGGFCPPQPAREKQKVLVGEVFYKPRAYTLYPKTPPPAPARQVRPFDN